MDEIDKIRQHNETNFRLNALSIRELGYLVHGLGASMARFSDASLSIFEKIATTQGRLVALYEETDEQLDRDQKALFSLQAENLVMWAWIQNLERRLAKFEQDQAS